MALSEERMLLQEDFHLVVDSRDFQQTLAINWFKCKIT